MAKFMELHTRVPIEKVDDIDRRIKYLNFSGRNDYLNSLIKKDLEGDLISNKEIISKFTEQIESLKEVVEYNAALNSYMLSIIVQSVVSKEPITPEKLSQIIQSSNEALRTNGNKKLSTSQFVNLSKKSVTESITKQTSNTNKPVYIKQWALDEAKQAWARGNTGYVAVAENVDHGKVDFTKEMYDAGNFKTY